MHSRSSGDQPLWRKINAPQEAEAPGPPGHGQLGGREGPCRRRGSSSLNVGRGSRGHVCPGGRWTWTGAEAWPRGSQESRFWTCQPFGHRLSPNHGGCQPGARAAAVARQHGSQRMGLPGRRQGCAAPGEETEGRHPSPPYPRARRTYHSEGWSPAKWPSQLAPTT